VEALLLKGGEDVENIDWKLVAILIPVCMALTEWIKALAKDKLGQWAIAVSMGMAFLTVFLFGIGGVFEVILFIKMSILVGLGAAGLYNGTTQIGYAVAKLNNK
jgi:hypothetical protein